MAAAREAVPRPPLRLRLSPLKSPPKRRPRTGNKRHASPLAGEAADQVGPVIDIVVEGADGQSLVPPVRALVGGDDRPGAVDAIDRDAARAEIEAVRRAR